MSSLHFQALSGRRKRCRRSSPFVSAFALVAVAALLALLQSVRADVAAAPHLSTDPIMRAAKPTASPVAYHAVAAAKAK
jgi:hypothetical protein